MFNKLCNEDGDDGEVDEGIGALLLLVVVGSAVRYLTVIPLSLAGMKDVYTYIYITYIRIL